MKILIIVEGKQTETNFFQVMFECFNIKAEIVVVSTSIYSLYSRMKSYNFDCDVRDVVKELIKMDASKSVLDRNFTYTYLVFDSDLQNVPIDKRGTDISMQEILPDNFRKLNEMAAYFTDETDPSIGRLYINYPMMESYRYCDSFSDEKYLTEMIEISKVKDFKNLASQKKLAGKQISRYTKDDFSGLIKLNAEKLRIIHNVSQSKPIRYDEYLDISNGIKILDCQHSCVSEKQMLYVLNTSLFMVLDYYGNRDGFYDSIVNLEAKDSHNSPLIDKI